MNSRAPLIRAPIGLALLLAAASAMATSVAPKSLEELVPQADEVVVATIVAVDVVDPKGRQLQGREARTGPGLDNRMRFHLEVEEVIHSSAGPVPHRLVVPLWSMWHYELDSMRAQVLGRRGIFLLSGKAHEPVYPAYFQRPVEERGEVEALLSKKAGR